MEDIISMPAALQVRLGTGHIFNGCDIQNMWYKEDREWSRRTENSSYMFPLLQRSIYAKKPCKWTQRPGICQDIFCSGDGTSFVTRHDDYGIRQYLIPDLKEESDGQLIPFTRTFQSHSIVSSQVHPGYSLYDDDGQFNLILIACRELPLKLYTLQGDGQHVNLRKYNTKNPNSDNWEIPHAIDWANENHFLIGSVRNKVSLFNAEREEPIWVSQTTKGKSVSKLIVSCFDQRGDDHFADYRHRVFGTYRSELYLMDCRMQNTSLLYRSQMGEGFIQLLRSVNGHYLFVVKRNSNVIEVLDTRNSYRKVNQLKLPFKLGNQKHKACLTATNGLTIGTDHGSIINWNSCMVEFGGIDRYSSADTGDINDLDCESEYTTPFDSCRINIVEQFPTEPELFITSHSPDKMKLPPRESIASGISIVRLFTM